MQIDRDRELQAAKRVIVSAMAIFVITTVHHVYGACIYHTLWRVHAAIVSGLATAMIISSHWLFRKYQDTLIGTIGAWVFIAVTFLVPFFGFGLFEGVYNHGLKDAMYFAHASPGLMRKLFPAPAYEMPNDLFFEVTGLMHIHAGSVVGYYLFRFVGLWWRRRRRVVEFKAMLAILANEIKGTQLHDADRGHHAGDEPLESHLSWSGDQVGHPPQKAVGPDAGKYLYDNKDKDGNHFLGVYKGGPDGKGPDFSKVNAAAGKLNGIIQDSRVATVQMVQPGFVTPKGTVIDEIGSGSPAATASGSNSATIYVTSGSFGTFPGAMSSDGLSRDASFADIFSHEIGHLDSNWFHDGIDSKGDSVRMENETRKLNGEPLRRGHDSPGDVILTGAPY